MSIALFDLDNTLIAGDSDYEWGKWLVRNGMVDADYYARMNERFYRDYERGELDMNAYLAFALAPLASIAQAELQRLREGFMRDVIAPLWLPAAERLLAKHRAAGHQLIIISATNRFIIEPICRKLGVKDVIATEPEFKDGAYTGRVAGVPSYREGKVTRLQAWLTQTGRGLEGSFFYSDSHNDIALLERVENPVAVDPDEKLRARAEFENWPIISLRQVSPAKTN